MPNPHSLSTPDGLFDRGQQRIGSGLVIDAAHVNRDSGGLVLQASARCALHQRAHLVIEPGEQACLVCGQVTTEVQVELRPVTAHQVDLRRKPR